MTESLNHIECVIDSIDRCEIRDHQILVLFIGVGLTLAIFTINILKIKMIKYPEQYGIERVDYQLEYCI